MGTALKPPLEVAGVGGVAEAALGRERTARYDAKLTSVLSVSSALFALGHFLGEWNPLRLGPFFPALVFAWQRNATGSVVGAIVFHASCNVLGELLFVLYRPV